MGPTTDVLSARYTARHASLTGKSRAEPGCVVMGRDGRLLHTLLTSVPLPSVGSPKHHTHQPAAAAAAANARRTVDIRTFFWNFPPLDKTTEP